MIDVIHSIFGVYSPLVDSAGEVITGVSGVDWNWIAGVVLFSVVLFSFFRLVGVLLKR